MPWCILGGFAGAGFEESLLLLSLLAGGTAYVGSSFAADSLLGLLFVRGAGTGPSGTEVVEVGEVLRGKVEISGALVGEPGALS